MYIGICRDLHFAQHVGPAHDRKRLKWKMNEGGEKNNFEREGTSCVYRPINYLREGKEK